MAQIKAYVLVETAVGHGPDITQALGSMPGLISVDRVTGPYDIIIVLEAESLHGATALVSEHVHAVSGVMRTVTCLATG